EIHADVSPPAMIQCPRCGSDHAASLEMIYKTGTARIETTTSGGFTGIGFAGGYPGTAFGITAATTSGKQQSLIAAEAAPPRERDTIGPAFAVFLGVLFMAI